MFWPSIYPRSRSPCRNASRWAAVDEGEPLCRTPIRGTFPVCCASTGCINARMTTASMETKIPYSWISPDYCCLMPVAFLFDHLVRSNHYVGWYHQADLLRSFEIDDQLELRWLFHR